MAANPPARDREITHRTPALLATALLVLLGSVTMPAAAAAEDPREVEGRSLFGRGEYRKALEVFSTLYAESADPVYLRNIGRCHQLLRAPEPAIDAFRGYLRRGRDLRPSEREEIQGYIKEMEALAAEQRQGRSEAVAGAVPTPVPVAPAAAETPSLLVTTEPPPQTQSPRFYKRWWFWTAVVGGVAAGTATAFILANRNSTPSRPPCTADICP